VSVELAVELAEVTADERELELDLVATSEPSLTELVIVFTLLVDSFSDVVREIIVLVCSLVTAVLKLESKVFKLVIVSIADDDDAVVVEDCVVEVESPTARLFLPADDNAAFSLFSAVCTSPIADLAPVIELYLALSIANSLYNFARVLDTDDEVEPELDVLPVDVESEPLPDAVDASVLPDESESPPDGVVSLELGFPDGVDALASEELSFSVESPLGIEGVEAVGSDVASEELSFDVD